MTNSGKTELLTIIGDKCNGSIIVTLEEFFYLMNDFKHYCAQCVEFHVELARLTGLPETFACFEEAIIATDEEVLYLHAPAAKRSYRLTKLEVLAEHYPEIFKNPDRFIELARIAP